MYSRKAQSRGLLGCGQKLAAGHREAVGEPEDANRVLHGHVVFKNPQTQVFDPLLHLFRGFRERFARRRRSPA